MTRRPKQAPRTRMIPLRTVLILCLVTFLAGAAGALVSREFLVGGTGGRGWVPGTSGSMDQELQALEAAARAHPDSADAWAGLGNAYFDRDRYGEAIQAYEKSLAIDGSNPDVWTDLGVMYRRSGHPKKAVEAFDRAMAVDPRHEFSRLNKGIVLLHDLKDPQGALKTWEALLQINPFATLADGRLLADVVKALKGSMPPKK